MSKEYYCEDCELWVGEDQVEVEMLGDTPAYIHFNLPAENCQLYHETEVREV